MCVDRPTDRQLLFYVGINMVVSEAYVGCACETTDCECELN